VITNSPAACKGAMERHETVLRGHAMCNYKADAWSQHFQAWLCLVQGIFAALQLNTIANQAVLPGWLSRRGSRAAPARAGSAWTAAGRAGRAAKEGLDGRKTSMNELRFRPEHGQQLEEQVGLHRRGVGSSQVAHIRSMPQRMHAAAPAA